MARRHNHYEAAFEDFLRSRGVAYLPVDEQKKAIFAGARIKSFDFVVHAPGGSPWLVDVKGRKFPYIGSHGSRYWENWVTQDDLTGLRHWQEAFGQRFEPVLVFVYWLLGGTGREPSSDIHAYRNRYYAFLAVNATEYADHARMRSPKWQTLSLSTRLFRKIAHPLQGG
jgi:hypothetical protein